MPALTKSSVSGLNPSTVTLVTFSVGDTFVARSDATYCLIFIKGSGTTETVTIDDPTSIGPDGATAFNPDAKVDIPVSSTRAIWIRNINRFRNPTTGVVTLTASSGTTLTGYILEYV